MRISCCSSFNFLVDASRNGYVAHKGQLPYPQHRRVVDVEVVLGAGHGKAVAPANAIVTIHVDKTKSANNGQPTSAFVLQSSRFMVSDYLTTWARQASPGGLIEPRFWDLT